MSGDATAAETWVLGESPTATVTGVTADTLLCAGDPDNLWNFGSYHRIEGGEFCTGLLRFDLASLPPGTMVIDASVAVWPELVPSVEGRVDVHEVTEAWQEGTLTGQPGVANYFQRQPGLDWTTEGGRPPGSSDQAVLHSFHPDVYQAQAIPLPPALVNDWLATPETNHGIAFVGSVGYGDPDTEHPHFVSSDSSLPDQRPTLTITFVRMGQD